MTDEKKTKALDEKELEKANGGNNVVNIVGTGSKINGTEFVGSQNITTTMQGTGQNSPTVIEWQSFDIAENNGSADHDGR